MTNAFLRWGKISSTVYDMNPVLFAWIGIRDMEAAAGTAGSVSPVALAVEGLGVKDVVLLVTDPPPCSRTAKTYAAWLKTRTGVDAQVFTDRIAPTDFGRVYNHAAEVVSDQLKRRGVNTPIVYHLSPGTAIMAAVWVILSKTRFPAELITTGSGRVQTVDVPFSIAAEYLPDLLRKPDEELQRLAQGLPLDAPKFAEIIHRCDEMKRVVAMARRVAVHDVPVLLLGESGTGKELFARAIHKESPRGEKRFLAIDCGAEPKDLLASKLFGTMRGAYTHAIERKGAFEEADGGTLFLDEVGNLSLEAQAMLLRVLQEGEVLPLGSTETKKVNVRVIAATNADLPVAVSEGRFRADLCYRLWVAVLDIPPLRKRAGDTNLVADHLLEKINTDLAASGGYCHKKFSVAARNVLLQHTWPGNVRELHNTILRAAVWTPGPTITDRNITQAMLPISPRTDNILNRAIGKGFDLQALMSEVARHYLERAMAEAGGVKTRAAKLVGLPNPTTLTNWLEKHCERK